MSLLLLVKPLVEHAKLPTKGYAKDAGWDLYAAEDLLMQPLTTLLNSNAPDTNYLVGTGLAMAIPEGWCGVIFDRSSVASKQSLYKVAGVIDENYRGEVKVCLVNHKGRTHLIERGQKIAQMLLLPVPEVEIVQVEELPDTDRGAGGFGSTGA